MTSLRSTQTVVRPLRDDDVEASDELSWQAFEEVGRRFGFSMGVRDEGRIAWARARIRHIAATDPQGSVVAERDGEVVGVGLALRRGSLWFLSLLTVRNGLQGGGVGRQILDATLDYARECTSALICSSPDPKALRRYGRAGFALHAGFEAVGVADRAELPAGLGVRDGDWDRDADLVEQLITARRGEPYGPDLGWCREQGTRLLVRDGGTASDRAVVLSGRGHVGALAATSDEAAARVLWAAIAETPGEVTIGYLLGNQQWAINVALAARLPLKLTDTLCTRGALTPPAPYLPSGIFG
jgi:predicted N-acetyltransferase YhbS